MEKIKVKFKGYKQFKSHIFIDQIKPINVVIGKNNIGKSSFIESIEAIYSSENFKVFKKENPQFELLIEKELEEGMLKSVFPESTSGGILHMNHWDFGKQYIGKQFWVEMSSLQGRDIAGKYIEQEGFDGKYQKYWEELAKKVTLGKKEVRIIKAERDIQPESIGEYNYNIGSGNGMTSIIARYLVREGMSSEIVEKIFLRKLNDIMGAETDFKRIEVKQIDDTRWEIFLEEENKGKIALSQSGSGLKTIIMVLVYTLLLPDFESNKIHDYVFMFEEPENNLHPAIQRRLLWYIEEVSENGAAFFLTTHSSVLIDNFTNNENVQVYHLIKKNDEVVLADGGDSMAKYHILDDLGMKASDILQSNCIIWLEGPSDKVYINKWIDLWSNGSIREGKDYICMFYGGRLLSHYSYEDVDELIALMNANRNSIIMIDSDKRNQYAHLNETKRRVKKEAEEKGFICWITKGKEIENYLPSCIIEGVENTSLDRELGQFEIISDFLEEISQDRGKKFLRDKVGFAKKAIDYMTIDKMNSKLDLNIMMNKVVARLKEYNSDN